MKTKKTVKKLRKLGYKYLAKLKPGKVIKVEVDGPVTAHFVKYKRLCHPVDPDVFVSKRPKVKEVQELYRRFTDERYKANQYEHNWKRAEALLKRALVAGLNPTQAERETALIAVMRDFLEYLSPPMVGQWTGTRWLDTNFVPNFKPGDTYGLRPIPMTEGAQPNDKSFSIDQTSVTLDQWGNHISLNDAQFLKKKALANKLLAKTKLKVLAMKAAAKNKRAKR